MENETTTLRQPSVETLLQHKPEPVHRPQHVPRPTPKPKRALSVNTHTDKRSFRALRDDWKQLAHQTDQMICMSPEWAASWWKHFGWHKKRSLFIVTIHDDDKLVAILPLYKGVSSVAGITLQRRIQLIGSGGTRNEQLGFTDDYGISDFLDFIVDPEYATPVAELFVELLDVLDFSDHKIMFQQSRDDSFIMQTLYPLLQTTNRGASAEQTDTCCYVELDPKGDLPSFIRKAKSNARRRFRQTLRARRDNQEYTIEEPKSIRDVKKMISKLMQLHQERWTQIGYPGSFQDVKFRNFFREISYAAYRDGRLWIKQAVDKDGVCAVRMSLQYNGRYYDYMSGYDDNSPSSKYRPGIGLLLDLIDSSFERPIKRIELMRGDEEYKYDFTQLALNIWKITIPKMKHYKTGWGVAPALLQLCSLFFKYVNRERTLLQVQLKKTGFAQMFSGYFKFRYNTVIDKMQHFSKTD